MVRRYRRQRAERTTPPLEVETETLPDGRVVIYEGRDQTLEEYHTGSRSGIIRLSPKRTTNTTDDSSAKVEKSADQQAVDEWRAMNFDA